MQEIYLHECDVEVRLTPTSWKLVCEAIGDALGYAEHDAETEDELEKIMKIIEKNLNKAKSKKPKRAPIICDYSDPTKFSQDVREVLRI